MRRKTTRTVVKENIGLFVLPVFFSCMVLFVFLNFIIPETPYEDYIEEQIVVLKADRSNGGRYNAAYDYIIDQDGREYSVTGEYERTQLFEALPKGTTATIKYHTSPLVPWKKYVEEVEVGTTLLVKDDGAERPSWGTVVFVFVLGLVGSLPPIFLFCWNIKRNKELQTKRDARINKRYGKRAE